MPFRHICRLLGAGLTFTEMVSAKGLFFNSENSFKLLKKSDLEKPSAVQIFGSDPEIMGKVCSEMLADFDIIDINMGCPMKKIIKNNEGSALMGDLKLASKIIKSCVATGKNITVKFRRGIENDNFLEFGKMCEDSGAKMITLHGRFAKQLYSGSNDYNCIEKLVKNVKIPVVANGDIDSYEKVQKVFNDTGCTAVMIARGALKNPAIFSECAKKEIMPKKEIIITQLYMMLENYGEKYTLSNIRKFIPYYFRGSKNTKLAREELFNAANFEEFIEIIKEQVI